MHMSSKNVLDFLLSRRYGLDPCPDSGARVDLAIRNLITGQSMARSNQMKFWKKIDSKSEVDFAETSMGWTLFADNYKKMYCLGNSVSNSWKPNAFLKDKLKSKVQDSLPVKNDHKIFEKSIDNSPYSDFFEDQHIVVTKTSMVQLLIKNCELLNHIDFSFEPKAINWITHDDSCYFVVNSLHSKMPFQCVIFTTLPCEVYCHFSFTTKENPKTDIYLNALDYIIVKTPKCMDIRKFNVLDFQPGEKAFYEIDIDEIEVFWRFPYHSVFAQELADGFYIEDSHNNHVIRSYLENKALKLAPGVFASNSDRNFNRPHEVQFSEAEDGVIYFSDFFKIDFYRVVDGQVFPYWSILPPTSDSLANQNDQKPYKSSRGRIAKKINYNAMDESISEPINTYWYDLWKELIMVVFNKERGRFQLGMYGVKEQKLLKLYEIPGEWSLDDDHQFTLHDIYFAHSVIKKNKQTTVHLYTLLSSLETLD